MFEIEIGDLVKLNPEIKNFDWGKGAVEYTDTGIVKEIDRDLVKVAFPNYEEVYWEGRKNELIIVKKKKFTKSDLRDGDICTLRNGSKAIYENGLEAIGLDKEQINEDLTNNGFWGKNYDIVKVERPTKIEVVFEREEEPTRIKISEIRKKFDVKGKLIIEEDE